MLTNTLLRRALAPILLAGVACASPSERSAADTVALPRDIHSYARPDEARVTHLALDLVPDFTAKRIGGTARIAIDREPGADSIILDVRDLAIKHVADAGGNSLGFNVGLTREFVGAPLAIALPAQGDTIVVQFEAQPNAAAVQWLEPAQTAGKKLPFLFTQGQAILTRTWVPTQDSPGIRQTYDAVVHVPAGMRAVMSAQNVGRDGETDAEGRAVYRYRMDKAIPPYLIALAVGDIAFRPIGANTGTYAEPSVVDRAASEFAEVDRMIEVAERLYGPYRWGRYDILVLPPSFPFGGMENPTLTFATPTILAGDRSLVALVAHELAHSWSGNLVTNATWDDFWLNEGFTTYLETRIMEELRGKEYADMLRQLGRQSMHQTAEDLLAKGRATDTHLRLQLSERDPDEGMNDIAYEKGAAFLEAVESVVGRERLDAFLRDYFDRFAFQPMSADRMVAYMREKLFQGDEEQRVQVAAWIDGPGIPNNLPPVRSAAFAAVDSQITAWKSGGPTGALRTTEWSTHEWLHFLGALDTLPRARLAQLDSAFKLSASGNSEVLHAWLMLAIRNRYEPSFPALERFLTSQGRRKFLAPLYTELSMTAWGRTMAASIYRRARPTYHSVATTTIDGILKWKPSP